MPFPLLAIGAVAAATAVATYVRKKMAEDPEFAEQMRDSGRKLLSGALTTGSAHVQFTQLLEMEEAAAMTQLDAVAKRAGDQEWKAITDYMSGWLQTPSNVEHPARTKMMHLNMYALNLR